MSKRDVGQALGDILAGRGNAANPPSDAEIANLAAAFYLAWQPWDDPYATDEEKIGAARASSNARVALFTALAKRPDLIG